MNPDYTSDQDISDARARNGQPRHPGLPAPSAAAVAAGQMSARMRRDPRSPMFDASHPEADAAFKPPPVVAPPVLDPVVAAAMAKHAGQSFAGLAAAFPSAALSAEFRGAMPPRPVPPWYRRGILGRFRVGFEPRDFWIGVYVGRGAVYVSPLPMVYVRYARRGRSA